MKYRVVFAVKITNAIIMHKPACGGEVLFSPPFPQATNKRWRLKGSENIENNKEESFY